MGDHARFSRARPRKNEQRPLDVSSGRLLLRVEGLHSWRIILCDAEETDNENKDFNDSLILLLVKGGSVRIFCSQSEEFSHDVDVCTNADFVHRPGDGSVCSNTSTAERARFGNKE